MRIYKFTVVCVLSLLLSACMGGINSGEPGTTIPAPTGLAAVPGIGQVALNWNAVSLSLSLNKADSSDFEYEIFRDDVSIGTQSDTTIVDTGLQNGQAYSYKVRARLGTEFSDATAAVTTMPVASPDPVPTNQSFSFLINWAAVPGVSQYIVFMGQAAVSPSVSKATADPSACDNVTWTQVGTTTATSFNYPVDSNCLDYCVRVDPENEFGDIITEGVQVITVSPETDGTLVDIYESGITPFVDVHVLDDDSIVATNANGEISGLTFDEDARVLELDWTVDLASVVMPPFILQYFNVSYVDGDLLYAAARVRDVFGYNQVMLCRVDLASRSIDTSFGGGDGCVLDDAMGQSVPEDIDILADGTILIAGHLQDEGGYGLYVWKSDELGSEIDVFYRHIDGVANNYYFGRSVTVFDVDGQERIVVSGYSRLGVADAMGMVILLRDDFGVGVVVSEDLSGTNYGVNGHDRDGILMSDGTLLSTGQYDAAIEGGIVSSYDVMGDVTFDDSILFDAAGVETYVGENIEIDCRDKPVIAGVLATDPVVDGRAGAFRMMPVDDPLNLPGLDSSFGTDGLFSVPRLNETDNARSVAFDSKGRGFLGGYRGPPDAGFIAVFE